MGDKNALQKAAGETNQSILVTGGHGLLGSRLRDLLPGCLCPTKSEMDIDSPLLESNFFLNFDAKKVKLVIHCAAKKMVESKTNPYQSMITNIIGTANVATFCRQHDCKLVYVSTDYVFRGDRGNYKVNDEVGPTNYYAETKLAGEYVVKCLPDHLIVRLSFFPDVFPYDFAYVDQLITRVTASEAAERIVRLIREERTGIAHVAGPKRTSYEFAIATSQGRKIEPASIMDYDIPRPKDSSLVEE